MSQIFILMGMSGGVERMSAVRPHAELEWGWHARRVEQLKIIGQDLDCLITSLATHGLLPLNVKTMSVQSSILLNVLVGTRTQPAFD